MIADLLLVALATWRLTSLLLYEDGPWAAFHRLRAWAGVYRGGEMTTLAVLFSCVWCMSVWIGLLLATFAITCGRVADLALLALAASAITITLDGVVRKDAT